MLIRFLLLLLVVWAVSKVLRSLSQPVTRGPAAGPRRPGGRVSGGELVQDPHCGVYVPRETALRGADGGYFCSETCRDAFAKKRD